MNPINRAISKRQMSKLLKENPDIIDDLYRDRRQEDIRVISLAALMLSMMVLEDVYGFGDLRLKRFLKNYEIKMDSLREGLFTLKDAKEYFMGKGIDVEDLK